MEEIIVFDANCSVCNRAVKIIEKFNTSSTFTLMSIDQYLNYCKLFKGEPALNTLQMEPLDAANDKKGNLKVKTRISHGEQYKEEQNLPEDLFIVKNDGNIVSGADVISHILQNLPALRPFRWLFERAIFKKSVVPVYYMMKSLRRTCSTCP